MSTSLPTPSPPASPSNVSFSCHHPYYHLRLDDLSSECITVAESLGILHTISLVIYDIIVGLFFISATIQCIRIIQIKGRKHKTPQHVLFFLSFTTGLSGIARCLDPVGWSAVVSVNYTAILASIFQASIVCACITVVATWINIIQAMAPGAAKRKRRTNRFILCLCVLIFCISIGSRIYARFKMYWIGVLVNAIALLLITVWVVTYGVYHGWAITHALRDAMWTQQQQPQPKARRHRYRFHKAAAPSPTPSEPTRSIAAPSGIKMEMRDEKRHLISNTHFEMEERRDANMEIEMTGVRTSSLPSTGDVASELQRSSQTLTPILDRSSVSSDTPMLTASLNHTTPPTMTTIPQETPPLMTLTPTSESPKRAAFRALRVTIAPMTDHTAAPSPSVMTSSFASVPSSRVALISSRSPPLDDSSSSSPALAAASHARSRDECAQSRSAVHSLYRLIATAFFAAFIMIPLFIIIILQTINQKEDIVNNPAPPPSTIMDVCVAYLFDLIGIMLMYIILFSYRHIQDGSSRSHAHDGDSIPTQQSKRIRIHPSSEATCTMSKD